MIAQRHVASPHAFSKSFKGTPGSIRAVLTCRFSLELPCPRKNTTIAVTSSSLNGLSSKRSPSLHAYIAAKPVVLPRINTRGQFKARRCSHIQSSYVPYGYTEDDYFPVTICSAPYGPVNSISPGGSCTLLLKVPDAEMSLDTKVLEVFVGGDTARNVCLLANNQTSDRPLMHDLLWQVLERGQEISKREWKILRVAIVSIDRDAFIGRLFFGDPETNKVVWDCDCRPSDGFWLSLKSGAPFLVNKQVWEVAGKLLRETTTYHTMQEYRRQQNAQLDGYRSAATMMSMDRGASITPAQTAATDPQDIHSIKVNDLEAIKLLKRELQLAIKEEDYDRAIEIRDHPYMKIYTEIEECKRQGKWDEAYDLQAHLQKMIVTAENQSGILDK